MTLNSRHINKTSFTSSPAHAALKKTAKVAVIILGAVLSLVLWVFIRPIFRAVGWVISILTTAAIILWLFTI